MKKLILFAILAVASATTQAAPWSRVRTVATSCPNGTACTVTVPSPTAGNLLVIAAMYNGSSVKIASATGLGTWVHPSGCQADITGYQAIDYIYNLSAMSGTTIKLTFSSTAMWPDVYYLEYSGAAPFSFDGCGTLSNPQSATATPVGGAITTTGLSDLAIAGVKGGEVDAGSAVSPSPFTTPVLILGTQEALTDAIGVTAGTTQARFTAAAASWFVGSTIAFKGNSTTISVAQQIANDQWTSTGKEGVNEGYPQGVPSSYDFYSNAFTGGLIGTHQGGELWAGVYVGPNGNPASNSIVNVRNMKLCVLTTSGWTCTPYDGSLMQGENDSEDWTQYVGYMAPNVLADGSITIPMRTGTVCNGTSGSDVTGVCLSHFYPSVRLAINSSTFVGIAAYMEARLALINPNGKDDRASASFLMEVGADEYNSPTSTNDPNPVPPFGGSKFKYVNTTTQWRSFAMTTLSTAQLVANPPPIAVTGIVP